MKYLAIGLLVRPVIISKSKRFDCHALSDHRAFIKHFMCHNLKNPKKAYNPIKSARYNFLKKHENGKSGIKEALMRLYL